MVRRTRCWIPAHWILLLRGMLSNGASHLDSICASLCSDSSDLWTVRRCANACPEQQPVQESANAASVDEQGREKGKGEYRLSFPDGMRELHGWYSTHRDVGTRSWSENGQDHYVDALMNHRREGFFVEMVRARLGA